MKNELEIINTDPTVINRKIKGQYNQLCDSIWNNLNKMETFP